MTDEERNKILGKIRKLLALKESAEKIGSEGEAYAAAQGVHRLSMPLAPKPMLLSARGSTSIVCILRSMSKYL